MEHKYILISHKLCPYVQRVAITIMEKMIAFERIDIDLAHKPEWFLKVSPLGKTPVLLVDGAAIFESAVICEFLDEITPTRMLPAPALERARHRAWIEFSSATLNSIAGLYNAGNEQQLADKVLDLKAKFAHLEYTSISGPNFAGDCFSLVDAAFAPVFRYFDVIERSIDFGFFDDTPKINAWRKNLHERASVKGAVGPDYHELLKAFLVARQSALSKYIT